MNKKTRKILLVTTIIIFSGFFLLAIQSKAADPPSGIVCDPVSGICRVPLPGDTLPPRPPKTDPTINDKTEPSEPTISEDKRTSLETQKQAQDPKPPDEWCVVVTPGQSTEYGPMWGKISLAKENERVYKYNDPCKTNGKKCYDSEGEEAAIEESEINFKLRVGPQNTESLKGKEDSYGEAGKLSLPISEEINGGRGYLDKNSLDKAKPYSQRYLNAKYSNDTKSEGKSNVEMAEKKANETVVKGNTTGKKTRIKKMLVPNREMAEEFAERIEQKKEGGYKPETSKTKVVAPTFYQAGNINASADAPAAPKPNEKERQQDMYVTENCEFTDIPSNMVDQSGNPVTPEGPGSQQPIKPPAGWNPNLGSVPPGGGGNGGGGGGDQGNMLGKLLPSLMQALQGLGNMGGGQGNQNQQGQNPLDQLGQLGKNPLEGLGDIFSGLGANNEKYKCTTNKQTDVKVCADNGKEYANRCIAEYENQLKVLHEGSCTSEEKASANKSGVGTILSEASNSIPQALLQQIIQIVSSMISGMIGSQSL